MQHNSSLFKILSQFEEPTELILTSASLSILSTASSSLAHTPVRALKIDTITSVAYVSYLGTLIDVCKKTSDLI
jgi:hypothetical protein